MSAVLLFTGSCLVAFIAYAIVTGLEAARGSRFFATRIRTWLDHALEALVTAFKRKVTYVGKYIITLSWYYSLHAFLKLVLQFLASVYHIVERILHHNRSKARRIRIERKQSSHLTEIADHKTKTALSDSEKKKRKDKALSGK